MSEMTPHEPSWKERMQGEKVQVRTMPAMPSLEQIKMDGRRWSTSGATVLAYEMVRPGNSLLELLGSKPRTVQHAWVCRTPRGRYFVLLALATEKIGWDVEGRNDVEWDWQGANINPVEIEWAMGAWYDMTLKVLTFSEAFPGRVLEDA